MRGSEDGLAGRAGADPVDGSSMGGQGGAFENPIMVGDWSDRPAFPAVRDRKAFSFEKRVTFDGREAAGLHIFRGSVPQLICRCRRPTSSTGPAGRQLLRSNVGKRLLQPAISDAFLFQSNARSKPIRLEIVIEPALGGREAVDSTIV